MSRSAAAEDTKLGAATLWLAGLITAYFYCLPLGRYSVGGIASDFRIYDFVLLFFLIAFGTSRLRRIKALNADRRSFHRWVYFLLLLVWLSLIMTFAIGGMSKVLPAVLRSYRFSGYLLIAAFIVAIADTPHRWRFLLAVFYANICFQAILACAQGFGYAPHLWPDYWQDNYWKLSGEIPVGTLSPHHKHIGIVMMLGVAITATYFRATPRIAFRALLMVLLCAMLVSVILAGIRTAWLGLAVFVIAYVYIHRGRAIPLLAVVTFGLALAISYAPESVTKPLESEIDERFTDRIERLGFEGVAKDRLVIYNDIPTVISDRPQLLLTGAGFQNVSSIMGATGAHNNYLQALLELGILGFLVFLRFLYAILKRMMLIARTAKNRFEETLARDVWAIFIGLMATMMVGETLWGQYSMFTLSGQIMTLVGLASCPGTWNLRQESRKTEVAAPAGR